MADPVTTTVSSVTYKVFIGGVFIDTSATTLFSGDNENTKASVYNIAFNRKVYSPNELIVDLQLTNPTEKTTNDFLKGWFIGKKISFDIYKGDTKYQSFVEIAVHEIIPLRMNGSDLYVRLKAYSLDHQLTLRKYCRSYVAMRPFNDILKKKDGDELWINKNLASADYSIKISNDAKLQHLVYGDNREECILPYMVQYNESFYDFICRTANRCGEFVSFENGELRYGLVSGDTEKFLDSECVSVYGRRLNHVNDDYYVVGDVNEKWVEDDSADDWNTSWKKGEKAEKILSSVDDFNEKKVDEAKNKAKEDGKNEEELKLTDADNLKYNFEINEEEHHTKLYKNTFGRFSEFIGLEAGTFWSKMVANILKQNSMYSIIKGFISSKTSEVMNAQSSSNSMQQRWEEQLYDKLSVAKSQELAGSGKDAGITPFVAAKGHVTNQFYMDIRKAELEASEMATTFNLGSNFKKLSVGQKIKYNDQDYVIVQVKMNPYTNRSSVFEGIDNDFPKDFENMGDSHMQVIAVPLINEKIYPPMIPQGHVRHADPQVAFVVDHGYMDPRMQGRLRVYYPWDSKKTVSPWLRVMVPGATKGGGFYAEAGAGDEVLVCYFGGNVERPYIGGYLRNRERTMAYKKGDMYMVSKNSHSIGFDDPVDPSLFLQGLSPAVKTLKSFTSMVPGTSLGFLDGGYDAESTDSKALQNLMTLSGGITLGDKFGMYKISMSSDQRKVDISSPFGTVGISAFTGITISAPNGNIDIKGKNVSIEAANSVKIISGKNVKQGFCEPSISNILTAAAQIALEVAAEKIQDIIKPVDMDVLRCLLEIGLHPVSGTMQIKSHNYLLLEAGRGVANISPDKFKAGTKTKQKAEDEEENARKVYLGLLGAQTKISEVVDRCIHDLKVALTKAQDAKEMYDLNSLYAKDKKFVKDDYLKSTDLINEIWGKDLAALADENAYDFSKEADKAKLKFNEANEQKNDNYNNRLCQLATNFARAYVALVKCVKSITEDASYAGLVKVANPQTDNDYKTQFYNELKNSITRRMLVVKNDTLSSQRKIKNLTISSASLDSVRPILKHRIFVSMVDQVKNNDDFPYVFKKDYSDKDGADNWSDYIKEMKLKSEDGLVAKVLKDAVKPYVDLLHDLGEREIWNDSKYGQIIFSERGDKSYYFDENGSYRTQINKVKDCTSELKLVLKDL